MTVVRLIGVFLLIGAFSEAGEDAKTSQPATMPVRGTIHSNVTSRNAKSSANPAGSVSDDSLGPVVMLQFDRASNIRRLPDGTYSARLHGSGGKEVIVVRFTEDGLAYVQNAANLRPARISRKQRGTVVAGGGNAFALYGRLYTVHPRDLRDPSGRETTYWLVGRLKIMRMGNFATYQW